MNADALSHEDYFNAPGETYTVKLDAAGSYGYYCEPHQGAGMVSERSWRGAAGLAGAGWLEKGIGTAAEAGCGVWWLFAHALPACLCCAADRAPCAVRLQTGTITVN